VDTPLPELPALLGVPELEMVIPELPLWPDACGGTGLKPHVTHARTRKT
jgi:hypothetical protein